MNPLRCRPSTLPGDIQRHCTKKWCARHRHRSLRPSFGAQVPESVWNLLNPFTSTIFRCLYWVSDSQMLMISTYTTLFDHRQEIVIILSLTLFFTYEVTTITIKWGYYVCKKLKGANLQLKSVKNVNPKKDLHLTNFVSQVARKSSWSITKITWSVERKRHWSCRERTNSTISTAWSSKRPIIVKQIQSHFCVLLQFRNTSRRIFIIRFACSLYQKLKGKILKSKFKLFKV